MIVLPALASLINVYKSAQEPSGSAPKTSALILFLGLTASETTSSTISDWSCKSPLSESETISSDPVSISLVAGASFTSTTSSTAAASASSTATSSAALTALKAIKEIRRSEINTPIFFVFFKSIPPQ